MNTRQYKTLIALSLSSALLMPATSLAALYGNPWNGDGLANLEIG
jgi:hypothetical protein